MDSSGLMEALAQDKVKAQDQFCLALIGKPLVRKSSMATAFPRPGVVDLDLNISRIKQWYPERKFLFVQPQLKPDGGLLPSKDCWPAALSGIKLMMEHPDVGTIIVDSVTQLSDYLIEWILNQPYTGKMKRFVVAGVDCMNPEQYRPYMDLLTRLIATVRRTGKPSIWIFHEREDSGENVKIEGVKPAIVSSLRDTIQRLFTDVWRVTVKQTVQSNAYMVRTAPLPDMQSLGASAPLPAEFEWDINILRKAYPWIGGSPS